MKTELPTSQDARIDFSNFSKAQKDELIELLYVLEKRRKIDPLSFHKLMPMQRMFALDKEVKKKAAFGGNRSGKSDLGAHYVIDFALNNPKSRTWVVGETYQDSVQIQQRKIWSLVPKNRIKYGHYDEVNGFRNRKLILDNGSIIIFKSYDQDVGSFASDDVDLIWFDEEPPLAVYKECRMRLLDRDGEMIFTMTSVKGMTELMEDLFEDHDIIKSEHASLVDENLPRIAEKNGMRFYFLWTEENPYIVQSRVVEESKLMTKQEKIMRLYGMPINLAGRIYPSFNKDIHILDSVDDMPEGKYVIEHALDPHDRKPWAMIWIAIHQTGTAYVIDEEPFNKNFNEVLYDDKTYEEYKTLIVNKEKYIKELFGYKVSRRIIDPNFGNKTVQLAKRQGNQSVTTPKKQLQELGLFYRDGIDALEAGHLTVRSWLYWEEKNNQIVVQPKLFFLSHCQNTIRHMSRYSRKDIEAADGDIKDNVKPMDKYKDFCDVVRYWCMSNPKYYEETKQYVEQRRAY